jgi:peptidoglycan/xylan/chitin deacetylase (PgdA/CDA1 family)
LSNTLSALPGTSKADAIDTGSIITKCTVPGKVALTFDDGPWVYTDLMLDVLASYNVKATFFIAGNNLGKGRMDDASLPWPAVMRRMHDSGHQIASHSWTHQDLTMVSSAVQQSEIIYNEMAFRNLFGWIPTYFRCPYLLCDTASGSLTRLNTLGYHIIDMNIDTKDYMYNDANLIQTSKNRFSSGVSSNPAVDSYIPLAHDLQYVNLLSAWFPVLFSHALRPTVRPANFKPQLPDCHQPNSLHDQHSPRSRLQPGHSRRVPK